MTETRKFDISVGNSRNSKHWKRQATSWADFVERCKKTKRTDETAADFQAMKKTNKDAADNIKDVGGFVGGSLTGPRRVKGNVLCRSMLTLDLDFVKDSAAALWQTVAAYDFAALVYSSHSHTPEAPRLRLVVPLAHDITPQEYEPIARKLADEIGINQFDDTTYDYSRLMYWPSTSSDGEFYANVKDGPFLDPDTYLEKYENWQDVASWPRSCRETAPETWKERKKKAGDPLTKPGIIGAFCRAYAIEDAIDLLLQDVYKEAQGGRYTAQEGETGRYSYILGQSVNGLVCYDHLFAYSHHCTDPTYGQLCNAFDLVRVHKFADLDAGEEDKEINRRPSFKAMAELASNDDRVKIILTKDAADDFSNIDFEDDAETWKSRLEFDKRNDLKQTVYNYQLILENDPNLKGRIWFNEFSQYTEAADMAWRKKSDLWTDFDDANLYAYIERAYGLTKPDNMYRAVSIVAGKHQRHPIRNYLDGLQWDGVRRLETLIADYLGADPSPLVRAMTRKHFAAAVARIYEPGIKYDSCLTLTGPEETGKSSLFRILAGNLPGWFDDSITTIEGKEGRENLRGKWIIELAELSGIKRSELANVKNFLSNQVDQYREAYGRRVSQYPRQCVFCATTNEDKFLKGDTGNRRFWVIRIDPSKARIEGDLSERLDALKAVRNQIWAEAKEAYKMGEKLYLNAELSQMLKESQEEFSDEADDPIRDQLAYFLESKVPSDWFKWEANRRRAWFRNADPLDTTATEERTEFCAAEFLCEFLGMDLKDKDYKYRARDVNKIMRDFDEWEEVKTVNHVRALYGRQRGYRRRPQLEGPDDADI